MQPCRNLADTLTPGSSREFLLHLLGLHVDLLLGHWSKADALGLHHRRVELRVGGGGVTRCSQRSFQGPGSEAG